MLLCVCQLLQASYCKLQSYIFIYVPFILYSLLYRTTYAQHTYILTMCYIILYYIILYYIILYYIILYYSILYYNYHHTRTQETPT